METGALFLESYLVNCILKKMSFENRGDGRTILGDESRFWDLGIEVSGLVSS